MAGQLTQPKTDDELRNQLKTQIEKAFAADSAQSGIQALATFAQQLNNPKHRKAAENTITAMVPAIHQAHMIRYIGNLAGGLRAELEQVKFKHKQKP